MGDLIVCLPQEKLETGKASQIEGCLHLIWICRRLISMRRRFLEACHQQLSYGSRLVQTLQIGFSYKKLFVEQTAAL